MPATTPERAAEAILAAEEEYTTPIPIEAFLTAAGIMVGRNHFDGTEACFVLNLGGQRIVGVNTRTSPRRQRFAMAHAFGHARLHTRDLVCCHSVNLDKLDGSASKPTFDQEAEANRFAAALLMPVDLLHAELGRRVESGGDDSRDALIERLATQFQVSNEAMGYRLISLCLIGG